MSPKGKSLARWQTNVCLVLMGLGVFQTNTQKKSSRRVFPFLTKLGWNLDWELKTMSSQQQQLITVFNFYQLVLQQNRLTAVRRWYLSGRGRVSYSDKMRQRRVHSLTSAIISHWANGLQLQWLGPHSFFLPFDESGCCHSHRLRNGMLLHPFRMKNEAQWSHVTVLAGCLPQICTGRPCPPENCKFIIGSASIITAVKSAQPGWIIEDH